MGTNDEERIVDEGTMGIGEAVTFTGLKRTFLYLLMERGELRYVKIHKRRLIPRSEITRLLAEHLVGTRDSTGFSNLQESTR